MSEQVATTTRYPLSLRPLNAAILVGVPLAGLALVATHFSPVGRELFDHAFRTYAQRWAFKRPYPADFFRTMEDASGVDLDWFWRGWFYGTDHVDQAITNVRWLQLDTRDALTSRPGGQPSPEQLWLRKLLDNIDVPELEVVPKDHVVTKTFYLLDNFVGRSTVGQTWIEALPPDTGDRTNRPVRATLESTISSSHGLSERRSNTSAETPSPASVSAACTQVWTILPYAISETSAPGRTIAAFPIAPSSARSSRAQPWMSPTANTVSPTGSRRISTGSATRASSPRSCEVMLAR